MAERPILFSHYSRKPVTELRSVSQERGPGHKPRGFWFSVDDPSDDSPTWASWCEEENFSIGPLRHDVELASDANVLRIRSADDLDKFTKQYRHSRASFYNQIAWNEVAREHQGIIIAPYIWERRLLDKTAWYYTWDVASGCIWQAAAVASITLATPDTGGGR